MRQRMNEGSQNMLRKRPLKAKRAVAIAKAAGRNQLAQTKSRVLEGGSSAFKQQGLPSLRAFHTTSAAVPGVSGHSQSGGTCQGATPPTRGFSASAVDSQRSALASNGCYGARPQPPDYSSWLEAAVPSRADPTPSAEAVSGVTDLMLQHTPDSSSWMGPSMFPQSKGVLCNDFLLTGEQVGLGTFGAIWKCERLDDRMVCACESVLKTSLLPGLPVTTTFGTEIAILDLLTGYENIIQQLGVYEDVTHVHVVTEMCSGGSLASLLQETRMLKEREAAWLFRKVMSAVNLCHTKIPAIVHRNLRPENVLFTSRGKVEPKLANFTQAVTLSPGQLASGLVGNPHFMAPEIVCGALYGNPADIWSLGVCLYLMLSGYVPFNGGCPKDIFGSILQGNVGFHTFPWPCISESCKGLIRQMLSAKPEERPTAAHILHHPWILHLGPLHRLAASDPLPPSLSLPVDPPRFHPPHDAHSEDLSFDTSGADSMGLPPFCGWGPTFPPPPLFSTTSAPSAPSSFPSWSPDALGDSEAWSSHKRAASGASAGTASESCFPPQPSAASFPYPSQYTPTQKEPSLELGQGLHRNLSIDLKYFDDF